MNTDTHIDVITYKGASFHIHAVLAMTWGLHREIVYRLSNGMLGANFWLEIVRLSNFLKKVPKNAVFWFLAPRTPLLSLTISKLPYKCALGTNTHFCRGHFLASVAHCEVVGRFSV